MARLTVGNDWLADRISELDDTISVVNPSDFNESNRYLPASVTSMPGYIRYDVNPYMREILDCADVDSPVREVNLKKGVQITYTTLLESIMLYYMAHVKHLPMMYVTADKELASARIENNIIPMLNQSGFADIITSSDEGNARKSGKNAQQIQFSGGGYLVPIGAQSPSKMRSFSIAVLLKDEIDGWPLVVGRDGDPDKLTSDRCAAYWEKRKIFRGSTPLIKETSKIEFQYQRGDCRKYHVACKDCGHMQELMWQRFEWDIVDGTLDNDTVRYLCEKCKAPHYEHDKEKLFLGGKWVATKKPIEPGVRSYHLPAMYSPAGMAPWSKLAADYLDAFDPVTKKVKDIEKFQIFYNNVLGEPFEIMGAKVRFQQVSAHRSASYKYGQLNNGLAVENTGSKITLVACTVDVHKKNLAVAVYGFCKGSISYLLDYWRFEPRDGEPDCNESSSPVWQRLRDLIEDKVYLAEDGRSYKIAITLIDSGYANDVVTRFTRDYIHGVYPILGRDRPSKFQSIKEFSEFKTQAGNIGYRIIVDHYKDRLAPVLRREWVPEMGMQKAYHFNAPYNATDKQLKELTVESRRKKTDDRGVVSYYWYRPGNAPNELWDLSVYAYAAVEILAYNICIKHFQLDTIDWEQFWDYAESNQIFFNLK